MQIEQFGPDRYRRWRLIHQNKAWAGDRWVDFDQRGLVYAEFADAQKALEKLKDQVWMGQKVAIYHIPLEIGVISLFPYDVERLKRILSQQIGMNVPNTLVLPEKAHATHFQICWHQMHRVSLVIGKPPTYEKTESRDRELVVPLRITVRTTGEIDLNGLREALEERVKVTCDELLAELPVTYLEIEWHRLDERPVGE